MSDELRARAERAERERDEARARLDVALASVAGAYDDGADDLDRRLATSEAEAVTLRARVAELEAALRDARAEAAERGCPRCRLPVLRPAPTPTASCGEWPDSPHPREAACEGWCAPTPAQTAVTAPPALLSVPVKEPGHGR